jgi:cell wall-associated NlpC family hydrolase
MGMRSLALVAAVAVVVVVGCGSGDDGIDGTGAQATMGAPFDPGAAEGEGDVGDDDLLGGGDGADAALAAADDSIAAPDAPFAMTTVKTTANVNLRKGPGTSFAILAVIPEGTVIAVVDPTPQGGFLNVKFQGTTGWSSTAYLTAANTPAPPPVDVNGPASPDNAIARARAAKGFSYYWGHGRWLATGPTASTKGSCSGSCPSCSHSGINGADCSGLVAKAWQFGDKPLDDDSHPYGTIHFVNDVAGKWKTVSRGAMKKGDALVYNSGGAGHIVLYEKGDGWGAPTVYECRGCSYGCVYNTRSFTSSYHAIRRAGF